MSDAEMRMRELLAEHSGPGIADIVPAVVTREVAIRAMFAAEAAAIEKCEVIADHRITICMQRADGRGLNDAKAIRDAIRSLKEGASHVG